MRKCIEYKREKERGGGGGLLKPSIWCICFDEEEINKHENKSQRRAFQRMKTPKPITSERTKATGEDLKSG